ncbi:DotH/IcmK family type IV secretion protein [Paracoccus sp. ME4]|uniref:DotH/IcmK family type IV secretion protein n=1 Tax=Paracoccus sp. ME4 TaxID=3138066 RepID=UPI00398AB3A9
MMKTGLRSGIAIIAILSCASPLLAQEGATPADSIAGQGGMFSGYVPSTSGMAVGAVSPDQADQAPATGTVQAPVARKVDAAGKEIPDMTDGHTVNADKVDGFNQAIEKNFPMTPDMIRRYREIFDDNQRALHERAEPDVRVDAGFISLEPGETPPAITLASGIASVIGFYDVTGQPWPISQYVVGAGDNFQVVPLGENNLAMTPLSKIGFTNLIVVLRDEPKPVVMRVGISETSAHFRHDVQILSAGPNASANTAASNLTVREAGSQALLQFLSGVDIPKEARPVAIQGADARGWLMGDSLFIRTKNPLLGPSWVSSMSGPDGVRVYEIQKSSAALFSIDGQITRADIVLP